MEKLLEIFKNHATRASLYKLYREAMKVRNLPADPQWLDEPSFRLMAKKHGCSDEEIDKFLATIGSEEPECLKQ